MDWNNLVSPETETTIEDLCCYDVQDRFHENYNKSSNKMKADQINTYFLKAT